MKVLLTYEYSYFTIYHVWAKANTHFKWTHRANDGVGLGQATYYKGRLKTIDAFNPLVVGLIWQGHYEWRDRQQCPDFWSKLDEWQKCVAFGGDIEWWCMHSKDDIPLSVKYLPLRRETVVEANTSVLVLEGNAVIDDNGRRLSAGSMHHLRPRPHPVTIDGDAKVWLIRNKETALPDVQSLPTRALAAPPVVKTEQPMGEPSPMRIESATPDQPVQRPASVTTERRFLVTNPGWRARVCSSTHVREAYLSTNTTVSVRVSVTGPRATLRIESPDAPQGLLAYEYEIPVADAERLLASPAAVGRMEMCRHKVTHEGRNWAVDECLGDNRGIVLATPEVRSRGDRFAQPPWLGREVTHDPRFSTPGSRLTPHRGPAS